MLHLKPSGKPEPVQASLGLYFSDTPPSRLPVMLQTDAPGSGHRGRRSRLRDDAMPTSCRSTSSSTRCSRTRIISAATSRARPTLPDGRDRAVDSDSRLELQLAGRLSLPRSDRAAGGHADRHADTSTTTPTPIRRNPHRPPRRVAYGQQTDDEMAELWFQVLTRSEADRATLVKDLRAKVLQEEIKGRRVMLARDPGNVALRDDLLRDADRGRPADRGGRRGRALAGAAAVIGRGALQPRRGVDGRRPDGAGESARSRRRSPSTPIT